LTGKIETVNFLSMSWEIFLRNFGTSMIFCFITGLFLLLPFSPTMHDEVIDGQLVTITQDQSLMDIFVFEPLSEKIDMQNITLGNKLFFWLFLGLIFGLIFGLAKGLIRRQVNETTNPMERLHSSTRNSLVIFFTVDLFFVLIFGTSTVILNIAVASINIKLIDALRLGLVFGMLVGLPLAIQHGGNAVIQHYLLRSILTYNDFIPNQLVSFLDYSSDLIFLRKIGGGYIFIHRTMMEYFAEMNVEFADNGQ
jgi:hypothetical protein